MCDENFIPQEDRPVGGEEFDLAQELELLRAENESLRQAALKRRMADDLAAVRRLDAQVESLESLGEQFGLLIAAGVSAENAFRATHPAPPARPETGALETAGGGLKSFYSAAEVDNLPADALDDPGVWSAVRESMTKWK